jgi:RNA polymerase sigma factor (sigma-70 family)
MTLTPTTRPSLLLRLRNSQDHEAWLEFVSLYEPLTYRLLRRHGMQDADAREIMQELFLIVSRNIDRWDPDPNRGSFRGWLRHVARNLVIKWLKHGQRRLIAVGDSELQAMFEMQPDNSPETAEFDEEFRCFLFQRASDQVRAEVEPGTWQAFWETAALGTSPTEAGKKLGMAAGAVRVAKCRVLARLKAAVAEMEKSQ